MQQISDLFFECFNDRINILFFDWKYFQNPNGYSFLAGVFEEGELIASGALLPEYLGSKKILKFTDLMTSPYHRNKGLSKKTVAFLTEIGLKETGIIYTLCSKTATRSFQRLGWKHVTNIIYVFKPIFPSLNLNKLSSKYKLIDKEFFSSFFETLNFNEQKKNIYETLLWRIQNPKFDYKLVYNINNTSQFLIFSERNKNAFILYIGDFDSPKQLFKLLYQYNYIIKNLKIKNSILLTISRLPLNKRFFLIGYLYNFLNKGKMSSILDLNIICTSDQNELIEEIKNHFSPYFYDDI